MSGVESGGEVGAAAHRVGLLQNEDDDVDTIWDAMSYEAALLRAKVPVEFHSYATGRHAFGLRRTKFAATEWPTLVERWLHTIGVLTN